MPRNRFVGAIGFCLVLVLSLGQAVGQESPVVNGTVPYAGFEPSVPAATGEALREQAAREGWVRVRVDLRQPEDGTLPQVATRAAIPQDDFEHSAQDLLFALPAGSYDSVQREVGSSSLTLRVDAAGLDELLVSPLVVAVLRPPIPKCSGLPPGSDPQPSHQARWEPLGVGG